MEKNLKKLRVLRQTAIDDLNQLHIAARKTNNDLASERAFKLRYKDISVINTDFKEHHSNLIATLSSVEGADLANEQEIKDAFNNEYYAIKAIYEDSFENKQLVEMPAPSVISHVKLPKIELLTFRGDLREFVAFKDMFDALVHNNKSLSNIEKFNYLISCLSGPPLTLVKSLPLSNDNYTIVYDNLVARYTNKRLLANSHWREIDNLKKISSRNAASLRKLLDTFQENLNALKTLGLPVDQWGFILLNKMLDRLDDETVEAFELSLKGTDNNIPTYEALINFVDHQCNALENISFSCATNKSRRYENNLSRTHLSKNDRPNSATFFTNATPTVTCSLCRQSHPLYKCTDFSKKSPNERYQFTRDKNLCSNCLSPVHTTRTCKSTSTCKKCNKRHHTLLHFDESRTHSSTSATLSNIQGGQIQGGHIQGGQIQGGHIQGGQIQGGHIQGGHIPGGNIQGGHIQGVHIQGDPVDSIHSALSTPNAPTNSNFTLMASVSNAQTLTGIVPRDRTVLLSTALVELADKWGNFHVCRALLDSGSQTTYISEKCANTLNLARFRMSLSVRGLGSMQTSIDSGAINTICRPVNRSEPKIELAAVVLPKICDRIPSVQLHKYSWPHISNLSLADPSFNIPGDIDLLLGADVLPQILLNGQITGTIEEPMGYNTIFGYVLMGKVNVNISSDTNSFFCTADIEPLDNILKRFWELEHIPDRKVFSKEDELCEQIFVKTTTRDKDGRFIVNLPFREMEPYFHNSRGIALQFLYALERRLLKNTDLYNQYASFMREYIDLGHMEPVAPPSINDKNFYLPHSCVLKPESTSTKLRVVFNASVKLPTGPTLNETLYVGPKLQQNIMHVLLKFRFHKIVFTTDVKKMYRGIWINSSQQDYQRILWRFSPEDPVQDYRLKTVTYGISSAPYLAIRTLLKLADDEGHKYPNAASVIRTNMYVDDIVTGSSCLESAQRLQSELIDLLARGGFELHKWSSNDPNLLTHLPASYLAEDPHSWDDGNGLKVLGMYWRPSSDDFSYRVSTIDQPCTKRQILSELARIYDPLGFLTPVTFLIKRVLQQLWHIGFTWDESPSDDVLKLWTRFRNELPLISDVKILRRIISNPTASFELHGFCDASMHGYSSVVYIRESNNNGINSVYLVCAKSRVSPLRRISIPRLELCAAVLLSDLITVVTDTFHDQINFSAIYAWSDSTIALFWIKSSAHRWQTFVSNRVSYIQENIAPIHWRHVPSVENPADVASRGLFPSELLNSSIWWEGPSFLKQPVTSWPPSISSSSSSPETYVEERKITLHVVIEEKILDTILNRFSSFSIIQRIIAFSLRFIHNCRNSKSKRHGYLTQLELNQALLLLVKHTQRNAFFKDFALLQKGRKMCKPIRRLGVFCDNSGLLRVGGRLRHAALSYNKKHPFLLPRSSRFTTLLIEWCHLKYLHAGCQTVQFLLAQNFWILSSRRAVRSVVSKCHTCWHRNPAPYQPIMGDLPRYRISQLRSFSNIGVDYGGPFLITMGKVRGAKTYKAYLCLFICMSTKALHLELASDLSTEAFLAALRRLIARRGRPSHIYSDCGSNFVCGNKKLKTLMQSAAATESIEWHFNPPHAPHFGGLWEAGIKSVKSHLSRVIGQQLLTYEEFYTVLVQTEAILNSRPLTPLSADPHDLSALTPAHFLTMEVLSCIPEPDVTTVPLGRLSRWQLLQRLHQDLWSRWSREYLHTLSQKAKWTSGTNSAQPGQMVVIKNDQAPPLDWQLGRIVEVLPGADGVARVATVRTKTGIYKRPLVKLCPLPISSS